MCSHKMNSQSGNLKPSKTMFILNNVALNTVSAVSIYQQQRYTLYTHA